jgi:tetratricopeptide (TPR) repeat protein
VRIAVAGRFANLEFDDESQERLHDHLPTVVGSREDQADYLQQALEAHRQGAFDTALRLYTQSLREDRRLIAAWVGQVQMLVELGEHHEARVWSDKALELFRGNGELLAAKAQACVRLRDFAGAYNCSDAALQVPGSSPWRWEVRGELLLAGNKRRWETCFEKALAEPAADWFDRVVIARMLVYQDHAAAAGQYFRKALELAADRAYVWLQLGECQMALGLAAAARSSAARALELQPGYTAARRLQDALDSRSTLHWLGGLWRRWRQR